MTLWILSLMLFLAPPDRYAVLHRGLGHDETPIERSVRYLTIAQDIAIVARNRSEAATMVAVSYLESGWAPDVDAGDCYRPKPTSQRCDGGNSASIFQIRIGSGITKEGWTKADLEADRHKAAVVARRMIVSSVVRCSRHGSDAALAEYASGSCFAGRAASRERTALARRLLFVPAIWPDAVSDRRDEDRPYDLRRRCGFFAE